MKSQQRVFGLLGLLAVLLGFVGKAFYREYIIDNRIDDYGIAAFLPSYFYVIGFSLLLLLRLTKYPVLVVITVTLASVFYELYQWEQSGSFDLLDIMASMAGGLTAIGIVFWTYATYK